MAMKPFSIKFTEAQLKQIDEAAGILETSNRAATIKALVSHAMHVLGYEFPPDENKHGGDRRTSKTKTKQG